MTVHGAKGLQAPLVILPDTTALPPDEGTILWATDPATGVEVPLWSPRKEMRCAAAQRLRDAGGAAPDGGAQPAALRGADPRRGPAGGLRLADAGAALDDACWYRLVARGFDALPARARGRSAPGTASCALCDAAARRAASGGRGGRRRRGRRRCRAWAGASPDWRAAPAAAGAEPARSRSRRAGRRARSSARCRRRLAAGGARGRAATGSSAAS